MAAVAGHINNFMPVMRQLANALGVMDVNALIEAVPCKAQDAVRKTDHLIGEVRGNLFHQRNGVLLCFFMRNLFTARFVFNSTGDRFGSQQLVEEILTRRKARANGGQTLTSEMHARHARQFLRDDLIGAVLVGHPAQRDGRGEAHKAVAPQPGDGEEFLDAIKHA